MATTPPTRSGRDAARRGELAARPPAPGRDVHRGRGGNRPARSPAPATPGPPSGGGGSGLRPSARRRCRPALGSRRRSTGADRSSRRDRPFGPAGARAAGRRPRHHAAHGRRPSLAGGAVGGRGPLRAERPPSMGGRGGDVIVIGDWDCDRQPTPAVLRPTSGIVAVFDTWAAGDRTETARVLTAVPGGTDLVAGSTCGRLEVRRADGSLHAWRRDEGEAGLRRARLGPLDARR